MSSKTVLMPAYNEVNTIINMLQRAERSADQIIVVDDGSTDGTGALLRDWAADKAHVTVLTLTQNRGYSRAVLIGLAYVCRLQQAGQISPDDIVILMDADGQHLPEDIAPAVAQLQTQGVDMLLGHRDFRVYPWLKRFGNRLLTAWVSLLSGVRYADSESGFRLLRVAVIPDLMRFCIGRKYSIPGEICIAAPRCGWKVSNDLHIHVPVYRARARPVDGITNAWMSLLVGLRLLLRRGRRWADRIDQLLEDAVEGGAGAWHIPS